MESLDPVHHALRHVHQTGIVASRQQCVRSDVVRADPQSVNRLCGIQVIFSGGRVEVGRELAFEDGWEWAESDVVRACGPRAREREEVDIGITRGVYGPLSTTVGNHDRVGITVSKGDQVFYLPATHSLGVSGSNTRHGGEQGERG